MGAPKVTLEYRAIMSFFLDGVPHHVAGGWWASKKNAQRDTAARALQLFEGRWHWAEPSEHHGASRAEIPMDLSGEEDVLLESFCAEQQMCKKPEWTIQPESVGENGESRCVAVVELSLCGVPHKLAGAPKSTEKEARVDAAQRALWYLQCPGFEDFFGPEPLTSASVPPVSDWLKDDSSHAAM